MKYKHFLIISLCISIMYIISLCIINKKYHIIEKLGNFTGNYNSTKNFIVDPKFISTDSPFSFEGPLKIKTNALKEKTYEYNIELPCNDQRNDYIPASDTNKAYCTQTYKQKGEKDLYDVINLKPDYRLRFLGYWKNKEGDIYHITKKSHEDDMVNNPPKQPLLIKLEILNKTNNLSALYKYSSDSDNLPNLEKTNFEGRLVSPEDDVNVKLPYITFTHLKNLNICAEDKKYSNDVCSHSLIKKSLDQKESDFLIWGGTNDDLESDISVKWYKTFDTKNATDSYTISKDMEYANNANNIYDETSTDINLFNLNTECSVPCKSATNCNAFAYIPAPKNSLNYKGKCIFYNVDKLYDELTFTLNIDTTLEKLAVHVESDWHELFEANKNILTNDPKSVVLRGITVIVPKKTKSNGTYLYELKNPDITATAGIIPT